MSAPAKVYQDRFGNGKGNCAWACIATIFGLSLDDLRYPPPYTTDILRWTEETYPGLAYNNVDHGRNYRIVEGFPDVPGVGSGRWTYDLPDDYDPPPAEFWMATVFSPGLKRGVEDPYYPMPGLHAVVMQGKTLYHDPNPAYETPRDVTPVVMKTWWGPYE